MAKEIKQPTDEQIRTRAYYLWEADGCPQGRDFDYWMMAEADLSQKPASSIPDAAPTPAKKAPVSGGKGETTAKARGSKSSAVYA